MRITTRQLAEANRFLTPFSPTGLTGLRTHPSPRPELRLIYSRTLDALSQLPASSIYRTATENITKSRLAVVSTSIPPGYDAWKQRRNAMVSEHRTDPGRGARIVEANGETFVEFTNIRVDHGEEKEAVNPDFGELMEGARSEQDRMAEVKKLAAAELSREDKIVDWEPEPPLTVDQINDIELKINGGLLEEVIEVAKGEFDLVRAMMEYQVWDTLTEQPSEGQWTYFERNKEHASA